jgi:general stress protein YciG
MSTRTFDQPFGGQATSVQHDNGDSEFSPGQPKEMAGQAIDQAKQKAGQAADTAREMVRGQVENKTTQAGGQVSAVAEDLRKAAEALRSQGSQSFLADFAERAAGTVEQAAGYLESADLETIMEDLKRAGRQRPLAVAGGLFALGFAASRLIKVSAGTGQE